MSEKFIISADESGLGNRLKCLFSMMRLSKELGRELLLYWPVNFDCGCEFKDLFENNFKMISKEELEKIDEKDIKKYKDLLDKKDDTEKYILFKTWRLVFLPGEIPENFASVFPLKKGNDVDLEYERIPQELRAKLIPYIEKMKPIEKIRKVVESYTKKYDFNNIVGLHARRGDYSYTYDKRGSISTDDKFINRMKELIKENPKVKFLLATDGAETEKKYIEMFPESIIYFPKRSRQYNEKFGVQEALVDLLLLSKCSRILGTFLSSFSEIAWWLGSCKAKAEIMGMDETEKIREVMYRLPRDDDSFFTKARKRIMRELFYYRRRLFLYRKEKN